MRPSRKARTQYYIFFWVLTAPNLLRCQKPDCRGKCSATNEQTYWSHRQLVGLSNVLEARESHCFISHESWPFNVDDHGEIDILKEPHLNQLVATNLITATGDGMIQYSGLGSDWGCQKSAAQASRFGQEKGLENKALIWTKAKEANRRHSFVFWHELRKS